MTTKKTITKKLEVRNAQFDRTVLMEDSDKDLFKRNYVGEHWLVNDKGFQISFYLDENQKAQQFYVQPIQDAASVISKNMHSPIEGRFMNRIADCFKFIEKQQNHGLSL